MEECLQPEPPSAEMVPFTLQLLSGVVLSGTLGCKNDISVRKKREKTTVCYFSCQLTAAYIVVCPIWQMGNMTAAHTDIYAEIIQP